MRTTLDIDADVLSAAKELAQAQHSTAGKVLSDLARRALTGGYTGPETIALAADQAKATYGFRPFPKQGKLVTNEMIDQLRDEEGV